MIEEKTKSYGAHHYSFSLFKFSTNQAREFDILSSFFLFSNSLVFLLKQAALKSFNTAARPN
jgi:hypothetical protein